MFKKGLKDSLWCGKGFKVKVCEENVDLLKKLEADVFEVKKNKAKK
tara:strand:- start:1189 stop:1326 length:138 start_codon:yes stop_codon:yes gene_type:complete